MATRDETKKRIMRVATKTPIKGSELYDKLVHKYPNDYDRNSDARSIGRPLGDLLQEGKLVKSGPKSQPKYAKV
jgi:hypothetical protein